MDLASINLGQTVTVKWRGKPVFIKHRTDEDVAECNKAPVAEMRHPQTDAERVKKPEWCVRSAIANRETRPCLGARRRSLAGSNPPLSPHRSPRRLVVLGVCTHLGCVPIANAGDYHGWYCPCHGSHYDGSGAYGRATPPSHDSVAALVPMPASTCACARSPLPSFPLQGASAAAPRR